MALTTYLYTNPRKMLYQKYQAVVVWKFLLKLEQVLTIKVHGAWTTFGTYYIELVGLDGMIFL
jgi:hypothetical protein